MSYNTKKNAPISQQIKAYLNKESGLVCAARKEIQRRFDYLDWRYQRQILAAFLEGGKSDREWVYRKLYAIWDDVFLLKVEQLWQAYHEQRCAWVITKWFPEEYLLAYLPELEKASDYYHICLRLAGNEQFKWEPFRLSLCEYISIVEKRNLPVSNDEIKHRFFDELQQMCETEIPIDSNHLWQKGEVFNLLHIKDCNSAMFDLFSTRQELYTFFSEWNDQLKKRIYNCEEYKAFLADSDLGLETMVAIFRRVALEMIKAQTL